MSVFIDSSVWFAAANSRESRNSRAQHLLVESRDLLTSDHVVVETWLLLNSRIHRYVAETFWKNIRTGFAVVEKVEPDDLEAAWAIGQTFADQAFSIVDCTSFAVMQQLGIVRAPSFDDDFAIFRFGRHRDKAFEILR